MNTVIWADILIAVLVMLPLVGIPMWLIVHGPEREHPAVPVNLRAPAGAAPPTVGAAAGTSPADGGSAGDA